MDCFWQDRRVFVTGATGVVGSWLVRRLLQEKAQVVTLIRDWDPGSELIRSGDVHRTSVVNGALESYSTLARAISEHDIQTVFHLGAQAIVGTALRNPLLTFEANIRGTYNLLEACRLHSSTVSQIVVASSDKAYGEVTALPYREDMAVRGSHPYDVSKSCADLLAQSYARTYGLPVAVARCGNIFGGGDLNWSRIVPGTIRSAFFGERPIIRSDGKFTRDYVYVLDVVHGYLCLAQQVNGRFGGEAFNFSCQKPLTVMQVAGRVLEQIGRTDLEPMILNEARAEIRDQYLDSTKARECLGWTPEYDLDLGLQETIRWYRAFLGGQVENR